MADVLLQSLIFLLQPPKLTPAGLRAPFSCGPLSCRAGFTGPPYSFRWSGRTQSTASLLREKMIPPTDIWGAPVGRLTRGPTKLTRTKGFVNLVIINDSSCSDRTMSIQWLRLLESFVDVYNN